MKAGKINRYFLKNIRVGWATNSSSSHSIIFNTNKDEVAYTEEGRIDVPVYNIAGYLEEEEAITTFAQDKLYYFIEALLLNLEEFNVCHENKVKILETLFDLNEIKKNFEINKDIIDKLLSDIENNYGPSYNLIEGRIDKVENYEKIFYIFYEQFIKNKYLGIYSDLECYFEEVTKSNLKKSISLMIMNERVYVIDRDTGLKIRFDKEDNDQVLIPELIDMKITDKCDFGCEYCYQNSTPNGKEADINKILKTIKYLDKMRVFEIAVAGGEPIFLFEKVLDDLEENIDIKLNTTTKRYNEALRIVEKFKQHKNFGAIGLSFTNMKEFEILKTKKINKEKMALQYCPALFEKKEINEIINYCIDNGIRLVNLGFKQIGRGECFVVKNKNYIENIEEILKNKKNWNFCIDFDQVIVNLISNDFKRQILTHSLTSEEGSASMYIDLVKDEIGLSSYEKEKIKIEIDDYKTFREDLNKRFSLFEEEKILNEE